MATERRLRTMEENLQTLTDLNQTLKTMMAAQEARSDDHAQQMASIHQTNQTLATMLASQEARVDDHAQQMASIHQTNQTLANMLAAQEARVDDHAQQMTFIHETNRIITETNQILVTVQVSQEERLASMQAILDEAREDNRMTRNLWVRLARKYGWLEDDDFQP